MRSLAAWQPLARVGSYELGLAARAGSLGRQKDKIPHSDVVR